MNYRGTIEGVVHHWNLLWRISQILEYLEYRKFQKRPLHLISIQHKTVFFTNKYFRKGF